MRQLLPHSLKQSNVLCHITLKIAHHTMQISLMGKWLQTHECASDVNSHESINNTRTDLCVVQPSDATQRSIVVVFSDQSLLCGFVLAAGGGAAYAILYIAINIACNDQFSLRKAGEIQHMHCCVYVLPCVYVPSLHEQQESYRASCIYGMQRAEPT